MTDTLQLTLRRIAKQETYTIGRLYVDSIYVCDTIEDKDRGLKSHYPLEQIKKAKVYGETAIPLGTYVIDMDKISPKFSSRSWAKPYGGKIPRLRSVPGFDGVLIHPGNTVDDSLGCILVGINDKVGRVSDSQRTFKRLMDEHLVPAYERGETITITIQ